jgi:hypothetical protein
MTLGASVSSIAVYLIYHPKERYTVLSRRFLLSVGFPYYFWDNYCNPQSHKKHSLLALCSLLCATYGICSRQGELTDRRLVELEGQSPIFSVFLSLIHPKMPDPHRLEVSFLNPFQIEGRDNPIFVCVIRSESPPLSPT